ncbi:putative bifunctional diguanylate cyclase/phosphodiesterase [Plantactinospora soyae]|uniref:Diguanylate cyclase (GGDEF)-like protein/PAS domain S-box-containing protein n=1 Tax=Plantactinospora soyae TaxID=1544732 RepID=A0A927R7B3_9ACTN|nr:GGDEF domain-containing phosphodiesterase [Plantactinospora soyae]MBE1487681.1 diguanylate cyclase (GGDEF)-like protein/PAS domain S-box-containing protein [Plantactinospora soyae]
MFVAHSADGRARRRLATQVSETGVPLLAVGFLAVGHTGAVSPYAAVALAVGATAAVAATRLGRLALRLHRTSTGFGPCRGAGFLGFGLIASGLSSFAIWLAPADARSMVALGGLGLALLLYLLGMMLLPGAASTVGVRLRRGFDGLSLGISLAFSAWMIPPDGGLPPLGVAAALLATGGLPIITITTLRAYEYRRSAALCGTGAGLAVFGHALLAVLIDYGAPATALPVVAVALVAGLALIAAGARRANPVAQPTSMGEPQANLTAYPLLTIPAILATLSALYNLVTDGTFDHAPILLGLAIIPTLVVREVLVMLDIRRYARRLANQEAHFRSLVSGANDLTLVVGVDLLISWQSPTAARLFGLSDADVLGRAFPELMHPEDAADVTQVLTDTLAGRAPTGRPQLVTARLRDGHGAWRDTESTISDQRNVPEVAALVVHVRDVSERQRLERTLHELAFRDQLTGLANRRELMRTIVTQRAVPGHTGALLVIDLHGMSDVNDVHGRQMGDAVLAEAGRRLRTGAGKDDVVARLGGDEFAVVTVDRPVLAYAMGTRLLTALTEPYEVVDVQVELAGASIGLADLSGGDNVDDVLRRADLARLRARQLGRNRVEWYDDELEEQFTRRLDLERELPGAAQRGELDLVYQPVVDLATTQPVGTEALLRWRSPALGTVLPNELLPVAEDLSLLEELGRWVLDAACRQISVWSQRPRELWMSVNISPKELAAPDFISWVGMALAEHNVAAERLVLEIGEPRGGVDVPAVITQLAALRAMGVRTALDDFGSGQASLAQLRRLPVDFLKVDRTLVTEGGSRNGESKPFIDVVVGLGKRFGLEIIAEGLESPDHVEQARSAGCRLGQGYGLSRPGPAERVEAYLEEFPSPSR